MTERTAATRYAQSLIEVSQVDGDIDRVEQELGAIVALLEKHPLLSRALFSPAISSIRKRAIVSTLLTRIGNLSEIFERLVLMLAERDRLSLLPLILEVYKERLEEKRGVLRVRVTTTTPLNTERIRAFEGALGEATGRQIIVKTEVDAELVGGMVAQIGSRVYDGSLASHLNRLREQFVH